MQEKNKSLFDDNIDGDNGNGSIDNDNYNDGYKEDDDSNKDKEKGNDDYEDAVNDIDKYFRKNTR